MEIEQLKQLMEDDRDRYLAEIDVQADGLAGYFYQLARCERGAHALDHRVHQLRHGIGQHRLHVLQAAIQARAPVAAMPRPGSPHSVPPGHPSFPSGHSFLGHLLSLLLLEIPAIRQRYGHFTGHDGSPGQAIDRTEAPPRNPLYGSGPVQSPLLWLSQRLAKNRERLGVHYASDSTGSRHLAAAIWRALLHDTEVGQGNLLSDAQECAGKGNRGVADETS